MARYEHLPLRRLEGELDRRKFGGGKSVDRDPAVHGPALTIQLDAAVASVAAKPRIAEIDPSLILKVRTSGPIDPEDWRRVGLSILSTDPAKTVVLFADDSQLQEFRRRVAAYQEPPPENQKSPQYAGFVNSIAEVSELSPDDRIGLGFHQLGMFRAADFRPAEEYVVDLELWQPSDDLAAIFTMRVARRLAALGGVLVNEYRGAAALLMRIRALGTVVRHILELDEIASAHPIPEPDLPEAAAAIDLAIDEVGAISSPSERAEAIGVIDSGVTGAHPLLSAALRGNFSIPDSLGDGDQRGHGTPVSGVAVYGDLRQRLATDALVPEFWIASAKVVNDAGQFDDAQLLPQQMEAAIRRLHADFGCRVINISLGDNRRPVGAKRGPWAAILDQLARELDLVIVVSAGNTDRALVDGFGDGIAAEYPAYLFNDENRILEPASAANVLTVGSIAHSNGIDADDAEFAGVRPIATAGQPSPFTRVGPSENPINKPDLVDYGGTAVFDGATQAVVDGSHRAAAGILTLNSAYLQRLFATRSGTSFSTPLVAYKAALVRAAFPRGSANLTRALLALSAETPAAALDCLRDFDEDDILRIAGHGLADIENAVASDDNRVILYAEDSLQADRFAVYEIPIPDLLRQTPGRKEIKVALAYDPPVRHTRLDYLGHTMSFDLVRGAPSGDVFRSYRRWETKTEGPAFKLANKYICDMQPGRQRRQRGTLQCARFTAQRSMSDYGDRYSLVVRCESNWSAEPGQRFAVAVQLRHESEIALFEEVRVRVRA